MHSNCYYNCHNSAHQDGLKRQRRMLIRQKCEGFTSPLQITPEIHGLPLGRYVGRREYRAFPRSRREIAVPSTTDGGARSAGRESSICENTGTTPPFLLFKISSSRMHTGLAGEWFCPRLRYFRLFLVRRSTGLAESAIPPLPWTRRGYLHAEIGRRAASTSSGPRPVALSQPEQARTRSADTAGETPARATIDE